MVLIIIRGFNFVNFWFSFGGKAWEIRQPVAGPICRDSRVGGGGNQQVWRDRIPISRMEGKNQNDHSGWMPRPLAV